MSFALNCHFTVKNGKVDGFNRLMHTEVLPLLNNEKGFRQDLTLLDGNRRPRGPAGPRPGRTPLRATGLKLLEGKAVEILDAEEVCEGPLELFEEAPEPVSSSEPCDINPDDGGVQNDCDGGGDDDDDDDDGDDDYGDEPGRHIGIDPPHGPTTGRVVGNAAEDRPGCRSLPSTLNASGT